MLDLREEGMMGDERWEMGGILSPGEKSPGDRRRGGRDVLMFCLSLFLSFFVFSRENLIVDKSGVQPPLLLPHENALRG